MTTTITATPHIPAQNVNSGGVIKHSHNPLKGLASKDQEGTVKRAALAGSALTTLAYLFALAKGKNKGNFKIKDMFKIEFGTFSAMGLATSAVIGGLTGGLLTDKKENQKPKLKEAMHQFLGNIVTPIGIVGTATEIIKKKNLTLGKKCLYGGLAAIIGVGSGVTLGNYIASKVNHVIFKEKDDRKVGVKDFGIHVDDLLTVAALSDLGAKVQAFTSAALPAIFLICGYEAGTKTKDSKPHSH